jgi:hypothetical protein
MEEIMAKIAHAKNGCNMNIKENFYMYIFKQCNKLMYKKPMKAIIGTFFLTQLPLI